MTFDEEHTIETFKSLISVSMEGLKALLLINGGAVVALLAFLGQSSLSSSLAPHFWWPIGLFVGGVTFCAFAFVGSYFTQFSLYNEHFPKRGYKGPRHMTCLLATVGFVFASVACFASGAFASVSVLANHMSPQVSKQSSAPVQAASPPALSGSAASSPAQHSQQSEVGPNHSFQRTASGGR